MDSAWVSNPHVRLDTTVLMSCLSLMTYEVIKFDYFSLKIFVFITY